MYLRGSSGAVSCPQQEGPVDIKYAKARRQGLAVQSGRTAYSQSTACKTSKFNQRTMPRELEPSSNEKIFVLEALQQALRVDGRQLDEFRKVDISFGEEFGLADVKLGRTR